MSDWIDELVDAQLAARPQPQFNCHQCGPVNIGGGCDKPYPHCPKRWMQGKGKDE